MNPTRVLLAVSLVAALFHPNSSLADHSFGQQLGTVKFEVNGTPEAREHVVRGVKLVHHMMYVEAEREFSAAAAADPNCAFAWWGQAMSFIHPLWPDVPSDAERARGAEFLRRGVAVARTPRERAYLAILDHYFGTAAAPDHVGRLRALDDRWQALAEQFPDDLDALAFSALYHLAPARFVAKDKSHRLQLEAGQRLQAVLAKIPDHPGAQHYKIHAYDFPMLADRAIEVCDNYSSIAPDVPHALHMPTHIFTRRGLWDKSIEFNLRSAEAARKLGEAAGALNGHYPHALDYLAYAYLQRGQYREADSIKRRIVSLNGPYAPTQLTNIAFSFSAIPARYALERQAWSEAAALPFHEPSGFPWSKYHNNCDSIVRYARAIGAARSGKLDLARGEITELERLVNDLKEAKREPYWISQAETQVLAARAWVAFASKKTDEGLALMRRAAALEATADKEAVTPGEVLPAGDLLGDMLIEAGKPADALEAFEAVLVASPNRLNTIYGAGLAAERAGNMKKALQHYGQLASIASSADAGIARIEHARSFVAKNGAVRTE